MLKIITNKFVIGGLIVLALLATGYFIGRKTAKPQITTTHSVDTLRTVDTIKVVITRKGQVICKTDTVKWEDTATIEGYQSLLEALTSQGTDQTTTEQPQATGKNWNIGVLGGVSYGQKSKDIKPLVGFPIRYHRLLAMPYVEYNQEVRCGLGVGGTF